MQALIKYKTYCDKKANASKFKQAEYVYVFQPKIDRRLIKFIFTEFRWIELHVIEEALPNNNYLVPKIATNKNAAA